MKRPHSPVLLSLAVGWLACGSATSASPKAALDPRPARTPEQEQTAEPTLAQRFLSTYAAIETITCVIRKTTVGGGPTVRTLSRVHFKRPDHIHVDNTAPVKRRIIADGSRLYYHQAGAKHGFSRPIEELDKNWLLMLRNVPGTPMEYLLRLQELEEIELPSTPDFPLRRGYRADKRFVVLACDPEERLRQIEFFDTARMKNRTGRCRYDNYKQILPHCWLPRFHREEVFAAGTAVPESKPMATVTRRIENLVVNKPIPAGLFVSETFFKDVEFVDDFRKTMQGH